MKNPLSLPESIDKFKSSLGPFGRKWYNDSEMMKKFKMANLQLAKGWFEDTVTDNLFLYCRIVKNN